MNCKVGDLVKITGNCNAHGFTIGETVRLKCEEHFLGLKVWEAERLDGHDNWLVRESDMAPVKPATIQKKIIITTDGKTTLARLFDGKTMVKRAEAQCAPSDVFDFGVGAELAVKRLMGEKPVTEPVKSESVKLYCIQGKAGYLTKGKVYETDKRHFLFDNGFNGPIYNWEVERFDSDDYLKNHLVPLVRRPARVGEWVIATNERGHGVPINTPVCVKEILKYTKYIEVNYTLEQGCNILRPDQYLVLDGYHGDPA